MKNKTVKKSKKSYKEKITYKKVLAFFVAAMFLFFLAEVVWTKIKQYDSAYNTAGLYGISNAISLAVDGLGVEAPVEASTGDSYFPQARLYLPNSNLQKLIYNYSEEGEFGVEELNITTQNVINSANASLSGSNTLDTAMNQVPKLQACARGYKLIYEDITSQDLGNYKIVEIVKLSNGKTLFVYLDTGCPNLEEIDIDFSKLQSY